MKSSVVLIISIAFLPTIALGQEQEEGSEPVEMIKDAAELGAADLVGRLDLDVPESPGFTILGIAPQNVIRPDTPAELAQAIFIGDDAEGNEQQGLSIEFRPYLISEGSDITIRKYRDNPWLARSSISFTRTDGTSEADRSERQAIGFSFTPIDHRDPLMSSELAECLSRGITTQRDILTEQLTKEFSDALANLSQAESNPATTTAEKEKLQKIADEKQKLLDDDDKAVRKAEVEKLNATCGTDHAKNTIYATQLQLGVAFHDSVVGEIDESGGAFWLSYALPAFSGSVTTHFRYGENMLVSDADNEGQYLVKDESVIAFRFRKGDEKKAFMIESAYTDENFEINVLDDTYTTILVGMEFRIMDSLWIQFAMGDTFGSDREKDLALNGQLRWATSKTRLWQP